jgi:hypothetical protein
MSVETYIRVTTKAQGFGSSFWNVLHFTRAGFEGDYNALADLMIAQWCFPFNHWSSDRMQFTACRVEGFGEGSPPTIEKQIVNLLGRWPEPYTAAQVAVVIQLKTALKGRSKQGRIFAPCIPRSWCLNGTLEASAGVAAEYNAIQTQLTQKFIDTGHANFKGLRLVVRSRKLGSTQPVTAMVVQPILGVIRKRKVGVGI